MKKFIKLTSLERNFLLKIENNPQAKEHERESARKVLYMADWMSPSTGEGQSPETQALFERLNQRHASMARSILFFLKEAYPESWKKEDPQNEL